MKPLLEASQLRKFYKNIKAVDGLDLQLHPGECLALLGPNGAGKTTTVEMLEGLIKPDSGAVKIFDLPLNSANRATIMEQVGVTLQENQLYKKNTVQETIRLFRSFFKQGLSVAKTIEMVNLKDKAHERLENLSGGQKQRIYLACALVNDPQLIFLDEPTTGLDPQSRRSIWELLQEFKNLKKSILLTTHYMDEAAFLADRVAVIDHGKIIASGTPDELVHRYCGEQILKFSFDAAVEWSTVEEHLHWGSKLKYQQNSFEIATDDPLTMITKLKDFSQSQNVGLTGFELRRSTLEDVFLTLTGRSMRDV